MRKEKKKTLPRIKENVQVAGGEPCKAMHKFTFANVCNYESCSISEIQGPSLSTFSRSRHNLIWQVACINVGLHHGRMDQPFLTTIVHQVYVV